MRRFNKYSAVIAVALAILLTAVIVRTRTAPVADLDAPPAGDPNPYGEDPYPNLPPLSALSRLPSHEIVTEWGKLQMAAMDEVQAKVHDETLPTLLRVKYSMIAGDIGDRMSWVAEMQIAFDPTKDECSRRNALRYLQGYDAYYTGRWPPPVPAKLMPE